MYIKKYKGINVTKDLYNMHKFNSALLYKREVVINKKMKKFTNEVINEEYLNIPEIYDIMCREKHELKELMLLQTMYSYKMNNRRYYVYEQQLNKFRKIYAHWKTLTRNTFLTYVMKVPQFLVNNFYGECEV